MARSPRVLVGCGGAIIVDGAGQASGTPAGAALQPFYPILAVTGLYKFIGGMLVSAPRFSAWLEDNLTEGFTVFDFPLCSWRPARSSRSENVIVLASQ